VDERSSINRSVILPHVEIGANCRIEGAILDEHCEVPNGMQIGLDREADQKRFHVTEKGVVLVTPDMLRKLQTQQQ
jgi:glucose-1-phosphate adenylyltransferase